MSDGKKILEELNTFSLNGTADDASGSEALPFESLDDFSTDPAEFGEMTRRMMDKVDLLFDLSAKYNRHSADYIRICTFLEKGVKFLGSCFLTKLAMEMDKIFFPELGQLSTDKLYRMASFNYRKLDTALSEDIAKTGNVTPELMNMEFVYFNLLQRLRSTELKIHNFNERFSFGPKDYNPVIRGLAFSKKSWTNRTTAGHYEPAAFRTAPAFPLLQEEIQHMKPEEKNKECGSAGNAENLINSDRKNSELLIKQAKNNNSESKADAPAIPGTIMNAADAGDDESLKEKCYDPSENLNNIKKNEKPLKASVMKSGGSEKAAPERGTLEQEFNENLLRVWAKYKGP